MKNSRLRKFSFSLRNKIRIKSLEIMDNSVIKTNPFVSSDLINMQERSAIFLALIAGYIDATGLIQLKTYVSFMSGNTTSLGAAISTGKSGIITTSITVISCFLLGIYAGTCLSLWKRIKNPNINILYSFRNSYFLFNYCLFL